MPARKRIAALPDFLRRYNWHRLHSGLGGNPPISRLGVAGDNVPRFHT
jgi:transposase InsO family protein